MKKKFLLGILYFYTLTFSMERNVIEKVENNALDQVEIDEIKLYLLKLPSELKERIHKFISRQYFENMKLGFSELPAELKEHIYKFIARHYLAKKIKALPHKTQEEILRFSFYPFLKKYFNEDGNNLNIILKIVTCCKENLSKTICFEQFQDLFTDLLAEYLKNFYKGNENYLYESIRTLCSKKNLDEIQKIAVSALLKADLDTESDAVTVEYMSLFKIKWHVQFCLISALNSDNKEAVELILSYVQKLKIENQKFIINSKTIEGLTFIELAKRSNNPEIIKLISNLIIKFV